MKFEKMSSNKFEKLSSSKMNELVGGGAQKVTGTWYNTDCGGRCNDFEVTDNTASV